MRKIVFFTVSVILVFNLISCDSSVVNTADYKNETLNQSETYEENTSENIETEKASNESTDVSQQLVDYALDNIDFQFVSDTGLYYEYSRIAEENYSNFDMQRVIRRLNDLINEQDFERLKAIILGIPDYNNLMREVKINYIVPILMHEGNYLDALRIVYKKEAVDKSDKKFLFDIIYLMRYMYVNNDLDYAIDVVDQLKEDYPDQKVSNVWFAISPRQYGWLTDSGYVNPPEVDSERNLLFKHLVDTYPNEPYIDYAYYFLGDYQKIIDDFEESDLLERAYYARAHKIKHAVRDAIYEKDVDRVDLALTKEYYVKYLNDYRESEYAYKAIGDILDICRTMFYSYGEYDHYLDIINTIQETNPSKYDYYWTRTYETLLSQAKYNITYAEGLVELTDKAQAFLESDKFDNSQKYYIWSGLANNAFYKGDLKLAKDYFDKIDKRYLVKFDLHRLIILSELKSSIGKNTASALFEIGQVLRSNEEYYASVDVYDKLVKMNLSSENLAKAYMLRASSSNKNRVYDEMLESYEYIVNNLGKSSFGDDALAEIGVHYLLTRKDYEKSREIFRQVIKKYPGRNAVNNAYNWIAWSYLKEKDYENALIAYEELLEKFPSNRFGINAIPNIKKIKELMEEE